MSVKCPTADERYSVSVTADMREETADSLKNCDIMPLKEDNPMTNRDSDTISRQDAIDAFHEMASDTEYLVNVGDFAKFLESMPPTESEPHWIPVTERLPEEEVLCCDTRGEMIIGYPYQDEESNTGYSAVLDDIVMIDCTAWMPLPEPYREGES